MDDGICGDGIGRNSRRGAVVIAANVIRINGGAIGLDVGEVGPGSGGEFRGDAEADVVFVEVETGSESESEITFVGVVLEVVTDGDGIRDIRAVEPFEPSRF